MPAQTEYEVPAAWGTSPYTDLHLPSGGKILAKRLDFETIIAANLVDEFDQLSPSAEENVIAPAKGKGKKPADRPAKKLTAEQQAAKDKEEQKAFFKSAGFTGMISIIARILPYVVIKPRVLSSMRQDPDGNWVTIDPDDREEGAVYSDSIPLGDQMHIFGWCMEGMDMEGLSQFREQPEPGVGSVQPVQEPPGAAE
jgi:hypothetical protein